MMPTTRCAHVRILLKQGKAKVVETKPFTVKLLYDTDEVVQSLYLGIDPGRTNIGLSVVSEKGETVLAAQVVTRNKDVPKGMKQRKAFRQQRRKNSRRDKRRRRARAAGTVKAPEFERMLPGYQKPIICHDIKNKEARFNNRKRPEGWLTPTANHLLETHLNAVTKLAGFLPISDVVLEVNRFAFMQMDNPNIKRWEYQRGPLYGTLGVKDAVYTMQEGHCLFCKKDIEHYHHIVSQRQNGSDTLENRAGLCEEHHRLVHTDESWQKKLIAKKAGMNKKYHALSVLNQIIPALSEELSKRYAGHFFVTTGMDTKQYRDTHAVPKEHSNDASCIAGEVLDVPVSMADNVYQMHQFRRHDRQACQQGNFTRVYLLDGKAVATNRHKAIEQHSDSLEEYRAVHPENIPDLVVKEHRPVYKDMTRQQPGSIFFVKGKGIHILQGSQGRNNGTPNYYYDPTDKRYLSHKCIFIQGNIGLRFV